MSKRIKKKIRKLLQNYTVLLTTTFWIFETRPPKGWLRQILRIHSVVQAGARFATSLRVSSLCAIAFLVL